MLPFDDFLHFFIQPLAVNDVDITGVSAGKVSFLSAHRVHFRFTQSFPSTQNFFPACEAILLSILCFRTSRTYLHVSRPDICGATIQYGRSLQKLDRDMVYGFVLFSSINEFVVAQLVYPLNTAFVVSGLCGYPVSFLPGHNVEMSSRL